MAVAAAGDEIRPNDLAAALEPLAVGVVDAEHDALDGPIGPAPRAGPEGPWPQGPKGLAV